MRVRAEGRPTCEHAQVGTEQYAARGAKVSPRTPTFDVPLGQHGCEPAGRALSSGERGAYAATRTYDVLQRYARAPETTLHADPFAAGVYRDGKGNAYITTEDRTYAVRYDAQNGTWRIYHPDEPTKARYAVRRDEQGNWQVHHEVGLAGGAPPVRQDVKDKARALLLEGWSQAEVCLRLDISYGTTMAIRRTIDIPPTAPLASREFREDVVARLNAGVPVGRLARDLGVQAETVELIEKAWNKARSICATDAPAAMLQTRTTASGSAQTDPILDVELLCMHEAVDRKTTRLPLTDDVVVKAKALLREGGSIAAVERELGLPRHRLRYSAQLDTTGDPGPSVSGPAGVRPPQSPQPGTSTGGWTYPAAARPESIAPSHFASAIGDSQPVGARSDPVPDASQGAEHTPAMSKPSSSQGELADGRVRRTTLSGASSSSSRRAQMDKAKALFRDGWSRRAVHTRLGLNWSEVAEARGEVLVRHGAPLTSLEFRERVAAQLDAGIAYEQIARDMNVHPESVQLIREALPPARPDSAAMQSSDADQRVRRMHQVLGGKAAPPFIPAETKSTIAALLRRGWRSKVIEIKFGVSTASVARIRRRQRVSSSMPLNDAAQPVFRSATRHELNAIPAAAPSAYMPDPSQPGTSTGGWTHRVRSWSEPVSAQEGAPMDNTAYHSSAWVDTSGIPDQRLRVGAPEHEAARREYLARGGPPADDTDTLRSPPLPELSARDVEEQLAADEFADIDMSEFKAMMDSSPS